MDKYAKLNIFSHDGRLQVSIYALVYVDPVTIQVQDHFPATKTIVMNYKKISTPGTVPKYWLVFSSIRPKDYELDQNFYYTEF